MKFVLLFLVVCCLGCAQETVSGSGSSNSTAVSTGSPPGSPKDFFPRAAGTHWEYTVAVVDGAIPLEYHEVAWPRGEKAIVIATRGRLLLANGKSPSEARLILESKGPVSREGPLKYPDGTELRVLQDDYGIFQGAENVYWAANQDTRYMVTQVTTYPGDSPDAPQGGSEWGGWDAQKGSSMRLIFFGERPGMAMGMGDGNTDMTEFVGVEDDSLHFRRMVKASPEKTSELNQDFTEDTWFKKGQGLTRLEQRVNDKVTMTWQLTNFIAGPGS